jgi:hypothetical protein
MGPRWDPAGTPLGPRWDPAGTPLGPRWDPAGTPLGPRLVYYVTNGEYCYSRYFQVLNVVNLKITVSETPKP